MRLQSVILPVVAATVLLTGCSTTTSAPAAASDGKRDFSYLRTPDSFRSFARDAATGTYETAYSAPGDWSESASRNSFTYWNAVMAMRTGNACFAIRDLKLNRREEIGTGRLDPAASAGPNTPMGPLMTRPPTHFYEFTALTVFSDCTAPDAIDARDYLSRTNRPELAPRKVTPH